MNEYDDIEGGLLQELENLQELKKSFDDPVHRNMLDDEIREVRRTLREVRKVFKEKN